MQLFFWANGDTAEERAIIVFIIGFGIKEMPSTLRLIGENK